MPHNTREGEAIIEYVIKSRDDLGVSNSVIRETLAEMLHQELQKAREQMIREVNSFSERYPEYGVRLYQWEDGTLGMDTITCEDALNSKQGIFRPHLYKEDQSELDQPKDSK